jgi:cytochrome c biogenesis protein CcdA/thioredoxin-related protein
MRQFLLSVLSILAFLGASAQSKPVHFSFAIKQKADSSYLEVKATFDQGFKLFSTTSQSDDDVFLSSLQIDSTGSKAVNLAGKTVELGQLQVLDDTATGSNLRFFTDSVSFLFPLQLNGNDSLPLKGSFVWLGKMGDEYPSGEETFSLKIPAKPTAVIGEDASNEPSKNPQGWTLFLICLLAGFLAVFTPCVFPLIPVTVSFFLKKGKTRAEGIKNAWWYAFSIILIYTIPTLIFTLIFGDKFIYQVSTHPVSNLLFFAIFIVFAISFFGAFELELPSSWANRTDSASQRGGMMGIFFMALTLVIVSFSCTGPIVAGLLSETSGKGVSLGPVIGMLGFGLGLAIPFGVFALFPSLLKSLPKSGGWLNTVKVFFGFIELALALKFFSNADLGYRWGLLDRDVFLAAWIIIFILLGAYLLGKLKFSHDSDLKYISVPRLFIAITSIAFAIYMIPGLWGAPLKPLSGILPPPSTQDFNLDELRYLSHNSGDNNDKADAGNIKPVKYADIFHVPFGLTAYYDMEEGLAAAKQLNKPVMIDFTGWTCGNCRKMENEVWSNPEVLKRLKNDFVLISLYVDDRTSLPEAEQFVNAEGQKISTIGDKNLEYEKTAFNLNAQPLYKFLDHNKNVLSEKQYGYDPDVQKFIDHLDAVKAEFYKKQDN